MEVEGCQYQTAEWGRVSRSDLDSSIQLKGDLVIIWEDISSNNTPLTGLADYYPNGYSGEFVRVWFVAFGNDEIKPRTQLNYVLYHLSRDSMELMVSEHNKFVREVGNIKDYNRSGTISSSKPKCVYRRNSMTSMLEVIPLGKINYCQIANKFPHITIDCPSFRSDKHDH